MLADASRPLQVSSAQARINKVKADIQAQKSPDLKPSDPTPDEADLEVSTMQPTVTDPNGDRGRMPKRETEPA